MMAALHQLTAASRCTGWQSAAVPCHCLVHTPCSLKVCCRPVQQHLAAAAGTCLTRAERLASAAVGPAAAAAAAAAGAAAPTPGSTSKRDFDLNVYLDASVQPEHFVGPVAVANVPGKGRGLVATAPLSPGQLLLVVPPLALLEGNLGEIPDHDELVEYITSSGALFSTWQADWLKALTATTAIDHLDNSSDQANNTAAAGSSIEASDQQQQQQQQPLVPDFWPPTGEAAWSGVGVSSVASRSGSAADRLPFEALGMDEETLWAAVVLNCYGEGFQDLPASLCAEAPLSSQLGLWGAFSMLNHACCPNAVNYTLRDCMVVRCCAPVAAGDEVVINYLGRSALTPLSQRQAELEACYGFKCDCKRCRAEASWSNVSIHAASHTMPLSMYLDQLHTKIGTEFEPQRAHIQIMQDIDRAAYDAAESSCKQQEQQRRQKLEQLVDNMQQEWVQLLAAAKSRAAAHSSSSSSSVGSQPGSSLSARSQQEACWVSASAFDLLGLLHDATQALGRPDAAVLDAIVQVCEEVCPGSDLHVFQALVRTSLTQQQQQQQQEEAGSDVGAAAADEAMRGLVRALQVRYGPQIAGDQELLQKLIAATSAAANMVWL